MKKIALFLFLLVGLASACSKDKMETKKDDITNTWKISEYKRSNSTLTADDFQDTRYEIKDDGTYKMTIPGLGEESGKWEFNADGTKLIINKGTTDEDTIDIIELTSKKLKVKSVDGNDTEETTYVPA